MPADAVYSLKGWPRLVLLRAGNLNQGPPARVRHLAPAPDPCAIDHRQASPPRELSQWYPLECRQDVTPESLRVTLLGVRRVPRVLLGLSLSLPTSHPGPRLGPNRLEPGRS
jgi:hypothetical protein